MAPAGAPSEGFALVTSAAIQQAAARLAAVMVRTPLLPCEWAHPGRPLWLKPENLQPIGSFEIRGAYNAALGMPAERRARAEDREACADPAAYLTLLGGYDPERAVVH